MDYEEQPTKLLIDFQRNFYWMDEVSRMGCTALLAIQAGLPIDFATFSTDNRLRFLCIFLLPQKLEEVFLDFFFF